MFSPIKNKKVYEHVIEQIEQMVMSGKLKKGDRLPSERALSEQMNVSRASIREALRALDVIGLIESRQGGGNYIVESFDKSLFQPLSIMFMLQQGKPEEITRLRRVLEIEAVTLAAERITVEQAEKLWQLVEELKEAEGEENNARLDKEFHYEIYRASGNFLLIHILNAISTMVEYFIIDARASILTDKENREMLLKCHEDIYKALLEHQGQEAVNAMKQHFDLIDKYYIKRLYNE